MFRSVHQSICTYIHGLTCVCMLTTMRGHRLTMKSASGYKNQLQWSVVTVSTHAEPCAVVFRRRRQARRNVYRDADCSPRPESICLSLSQSVPQVNVCIRLKTSLRMSLLGTPARVIGWHGRSLTDLPTAVSQLSIYTRNTKTSKRSSLTHNITNNYKQRVAIHNTCTRARVRV